MSRIQWGSYVHAISIEVLFKPSFHGYNCRNSLFPTYWGVAIYWAETKLNKVCVLYVCPVRSHKQKGPKF